MEELMAGFRANAPSPAAHISSAEAALGVTLPADYRAFLEMNDGGEGFVGDHYLVLWRSAELHPFNRDAEVSEYADGLVAFGSDGGGEMFAFDTRFQPPPVVIVSFIGMSHEEAVVVADDFTGLLRRMKQSAGSLFDPKPNSGGQP